MIPPRIFNIFLNCFLWSPPIKQWKWKELNELKFQEASENHKKSPNHKSLLSRKSTSLQVPEEEDSAGLAEDNFDNHVVPKTLQRRATKSMAAAIPFQVKKFWQICDLIVVNENFCLASDVKMAWTKSVTDELKIKLTPCYFLGELCLTAVDNLLCVKDAWAQCSMVSYLKN